MGDKMLKYFKWISLGILVICIGITIFLYIDFVNHNVHEGEMDVNKSDDISVIYDKNWYNSKYEIYVDDELVDERYYGLENKYLTFTNEYIGLCDVLTGECKTSEYSYSNGMMEVFENLFVTKGVYGIVYDENSIMFSLKGDNTEFIYYFEPAVG